MADRGHPRNSRPKSKITAALLAFLLPGMGHMYAGMYPRGLLLLAGLLLDCVAIVRLANSDGGRHLLLIVYLLLLLPVFYFISVYDALQQLDRERESTSARLRPVHGLLLTLAGLIMLLLLRPPAALLTWMNELAEWSVGPLLLLTAATLLARSRGSFGGRGTSDSEAGGGLKLGRLTAALLVLITGLLLIWDHTRDRNDIALLSVWWPVWFVLLGLEMTAYSVWQRRRGSGGRRPRLDTGGTLMSLLITATAFAVTQYADFPAKWLDQFNIGISGYAEYGEESGFRYDKNVVKIPAATLPDSIQIVSANGNISIVSDDVSDIELRATVWVDLADEAEAKLVAEQSVIHIVPGPQLSIEAKGYAYGANGSRKPRMNMEIVLPAALSDEAAARVEDSEEAEEPGESEGEAGREKSEGAEEAEESDGTGESEVTERAEQSRRAELLDGQQLPEESVDVPDTEIPNEFELDGAEPDIGEAKSPLPDAAESDVAESNPANLAPSLQLSIQLGNGDVSVSRLGAPRGLQIKSGSGAVELERIRGPVTVLNQYGDIRAELVAGDMSLETISGSIAVESSGEGSLYAGSSNGSLSLTDMSGDIEAETKNGAIRVDGAALSVKAFTLNGNISVSSPLVGGDWDLDSSVGEIEVSLPEEGHYTLYGAVTFGSIESELPFRQYRRTIRGSAGEGIYRIHINATNSIAIYRLSSGDTALSLTKSQA